MGIKIGDNNKIKNSNIIDRATIRGDYCNKKFSEKHPVITGLLISLAAGIILLFGFWTNLVNAIESFF